MQVFCLGLLLFSLAWAAPTFQPQSEQTKQSCVEEQKIMYKDHHEKHGYYDFKYVYTSPRRKNETDMKQEGKKKDATTLHYSRKQRQDLPPKKSTVQERQKEFSILEVSKNNQSKKSQNLFANRQIQHESHSIGNKENAHNDLKMSIYPESNVNNRAKTRDELNSELHDQEEYGSTLIVNNMKHLMGPVTVKELLRKEDRKKKPRTVVNRILEGTNYAEGFDKGKNNEQRDTQAWNIPVKSKSAHPIQHNTDFVKQLPKVKTIPSDFEGSGYSELQERGDNGISFFSGDGWPFEDIPGEGGAAGPDLEGTDIQTGYSDPSEAETTNVDTRGQGYNEIPEKEEINGNHIGARDSTKDTNAAGVSLVDGSNDIIGSTKFKELPGKEGNRVDSGSQNAHQGKVELHYPLILSKEKRKESDSDVAKSTNFNEIPKNDKSSTQKGSEHPNRNQATFHEKQKFYGKGKSQNQLISSPGLHNEGKNEIGSHSGPTNEENTATHNDGRKSYYVPHEQNNAMKSKGMAQRKDSWDYRRLHSNGSRSPPRKHDSSESSESDSSSGSDGD
ncbi:matrix extracellular phosphoglycoprotein [Rhynchocyon petersi]